MTVARQDGTKRHPNPQSSLPLAPEVLAKLSPHTHIQLAAVDELAHTRTDNVQAIGAALLHQTVCYYDTVNNQAAKSFALAFFTTVVGIAFFLAAAAIVAFTRQESMAVIPVIGGAIVELISALSLYLYGQSSKQLTKFHAVLDRTHRFIIANSICASIQGDTQDTARADLVREIATCPMPPQEAGSTGKSQ